MDRSKIFARSSNIIRKPVSEVYRSFIDPNIISKFWLKSSSGPLVEGNTVTWDFQVDCAKAETTCKSLIENKLIHIQWDDKSEVKFEFKEYKVNQCIVCIENFNLGGTEEEQINTAIESTQGFTLALTGLKTFLENGSSMDITKAKAELIEFLMK